MDPRRNKGTKYKQSEIELFVLSGWTCVWIGANTTSNCKGKVPWLPSVFGEDNIPIFCMITIEMV